MPIIYQRRNPIIQYLQKTVQILKEGVRYFGNLIQRIIHYTNEEKNKRCNKFPLHVYRIGHSSPITRQLVSRIIEWKNSLRYKLAKEIIFNL